MTIPFDPFHTNNYNFVKFDSARCRKFREQGTERTRERKTLFNRARVRIFCALRLKSLKHLDNINRQKKKQKKNLPAHDAEFEILFHITNSLRAI